VAKRGAAIIDARGASSAASAANAAVDHVFSWVNGTEEGDWTSAAVVSDGSYGVPEGLVSSFPVTSSGGEWEIVPDLAINDFSRSRIDASVHELQEERDASSPSASSEQPQPPSSWRPVRGEDQGAEPGRGDRRRRDDPHHLVSSSRTG
jgi:malate/lactate dehydrogenase